MHFKINFNSAFILSLLWHLFCFFAVTIIILPAGISQKRLPEVYFLGSLLDKSPVGYEFKSPEGFLRRDRGILKLNMANDKNSGVVHVFPINKERNIIIKKKNYNFREASVIDMGKAIPGAHKNTYDKPIIGVPDVQVISAARKILFSPPLSDFMPEIARIQRKDNLSSRYHIRISAFVENSGVVESVSIVDTSGDEDIDTIMKDYIKICRFEPLKNNEIQESIVYIDISFQARA
jgi:hypothetical protein